MQFCTTEPWGLVLRGSLNRIHRVEEWTSNHGGLYDHSMIENSKRGEIKREMCSGFDREQLENHAKTIPTDPTVILITGYADDYFFSY